MQTLWITYSWEDNKNGDVEFIAQELEKTGISVKLDRWNIQAGKRLWEQIDKFISNPNECDAWAIVATQNSLGSEPCKEEVAYALDSVSSPKLRPFKNRKQNKVLLILKGRNHEKNTIYRAPNYCHDKAA